MRRLRESEERSPLLDQARELLDAVDVLPAASDAHKARVRASLRRRLEGRPRRLTGFAIAAVLLLLGATAFAAVRIHEVVVLREQTEAAERQRVERARRVKEHASREERATLVEADEVGPSPEPVASERVGRGKSERLHRSKRERSLRSADTVLPPPAPATAVLSARQPEPPSPQEQASQSAIVHRALTALRRDGEPRTALRLLDELEDRAVQGPLREEAHALRIEAALQVDRERAHALAESYLERFPAGRYRALAERALGRGR